MNKTNARALAVCLLITAGAVCVSAQKRITVPTDFPNIQTALGMADEGDTVYVRNGVYKENIVLADDVVLMGQDKKSTIIDGRRKGPVVVGADGAVITGFTIRNGTTGILCKNTRPIIRNNIIKDNKGTGIHALVALPDIVNNVVYRNLWTGIFLESVRGTRTSIDHNVIMENGYSGIFCANRTEVLVRNNILIGNKQYGIFVGPEARKTRIVSNNIFRNRLPYNDAADNQSTRQQNISVDPQFQSVALLNFNLKANSPCKGKGEEESDIGLSEAVTAVAVQKPVSDMDQYFPPAESAGDVSGDQQQDVFSYAGASASQQAHQPAYQPAEQDAFSDFYGAAPERITETVILHGVNFHSESATLTDDSYAVLDDIYNRLDYYKDLRVEVAGHTDNQGMDDFNRRLSLDRARTVVNYLVERGISSSRVRARGYGADRPLESNATEAGRAANRRVEVVPIQ